MSQRTDAFERWLKDVQAIDPTKLTAEDSALWQGYYEEAMARASGTPDVQMLKREYFRSALHHQASGRFAAEHGFNPTAGPIFHQAIELYIKGLLCPTHDEGARRALSHYLTKAWDAYKTVAGDPSLSQFDDVVAALDKYWGVRYPDDIVTKGIHAIIEYVPNGPFVQGVAESKTVAYVLIIDRLDAFVAALWKESGLTPQLVAVWTDAESLAYLERRNKSRFW